MRLPTKLALTIGLISAPQLSRAALPTLQPIDFSSCANVSANVGGPIGVSQGNAGTNFSFLTFNLLDPAKGNNLWVGSASASLHIKVSIPAPTALYFLLNTEYGQPTVSNATIVLIGTNGTLETAPLKGGVTIRDFNNGPFTDTLMGSSTQEWWTNNLNPMPQDGSHRQDAHKIDTSKVFAGQMLTEIVIQSPKKAAVGVMLPLLWAIGAQTSSGPIAATCSAG